MHNKVKGFTYDVIKDKDVIEHLNKQQNFSVYLKELVRADMKKEDIKTIIRAEIKKALKDIEIDTKDKKQEIELDVNEIGRIMGI